MSIVDELIAILGFEVTGEDEARRFEERLDRLNDNVDRFAINAGHLAGVASAALAGAFGLLGRAVIDTSSQFETYQATLETIEGSAEAARQSLDWIAEFGKTTPYDVAQVTEAFVALKAYGIDPIADDSLRRLGDTASAMGKPLSQAVEAFADAATGEFERLKEFGIRAQQQGDEVTFSWTQNGEELTQTVRKNSNEIRAFLLETMGDRFAGAMDRQSRTWSGMVSNLGDTWTDFQRRIGDAGFFATVSGHLQGLLDWLGRLDADGTLDRWAENLSWTLSKAADFVALVAGRIATNIAFIAENFDILQGPLTAIGVLLGILMVRAFPLITIFSVLALAVDDFLAYLQGGESVIGDFIQKLQDMTGVSEGVAQAITGLGGTVLVALSSAFLLAPRTVLKTFGRLLFTGLAGLAPLILKGAAAAFALLSNPIGWAILLAGAASGLVYYFWDEIKEGWEWLSGKVGELATMFGEWFENASWAEILVAVVAPIPMLFFNALNAVFPNIKDNIVQMFQQVVDWVLDIDWSGLGVSMANAIWDGLKSVGASIREWFSSLIPAWAQDWFTEGAPETPPTSQTPAFATRPAQPMPASALQQTPANQEEMMRNLEAYLAKVDAEGSGSVDATLNDSRQDNRQFPMNNSVVVNQTVTQASDAPRRAADATGNAVSDSLPVQRSQAEMEPSF